MCKEYFKKNKLKPWRKVEWVIPPEANGDFVANMEDVLEIYHRPYNVKIPVVCMDETSKQCIKEVINPIPPSPGHPERFDTMYERNGTVNIFMACEPLKNKRFTKTTDRRTKQDWAEFIKYVVDIQYPKAEKVILVMDNLNTHSLGSLYETFDPKEARRIAKKLEIHYTPKHGSWLNIAEIELSVLSRQCLNRRLGNKECLKSEVSNWEKERNNNNKTVVWQFGIDDARKKLRRLYPVLE